MKAFYFLVAGIFLLIFESTAGAQSLLYPGQGDATLPKRLALVIGVENYGDVGGEVALTSLPDATDDAKAMAALLPKLGFTDTKMVIRTDDRPYVDKPTIQAEIKDFKERAKLAKLQSGRAPILLFYFSGHGFSIDGGSFLIPSNFFADDVSSFQTNSISLLRDVVLKLELGFEPALQIIITDSCRTPTPVNIPAMAGDKAATPGNFDPNNGRKPPAQPEFGKNRSIFLFSTLNNSPAFGTPGTGGRFTSALIGELEAAMRDAMPPPAAPVTLSSIFESTSSEMGFASSQRPMFDPNWGAPFHLLPFAETFELEKTTYESMKLRSDVPDEALPRYECNLRAALKRITEFSFYSQKIIQNMRFPVSLSCTPTPLGGGPQGVAAPPVRDDQARWYFPGLVPQPPARRQGYFLTPPRQHQNREASQRDTARPPAAKSPLDSFAQISGGPSNTTPPPPAETKPNFGEVRSAVEQQGSVQQAGQLPGSNTALDQAVVTTSDVFLRKSPNPQGTKVTSIPAGEVLQVVGTNADRTWLAVRHAKLGSGYVYGEFVEPALMTFSRSISFDPKKYGLDEAVKNDLTATFALLGGVAIVDGYVEYPESSNILPFTRASVTANFISQMATQADSSRKSRLFIGVRQQEGNSEPLQADSVRLVILGLPLDAKTRAQLAKTQQPGTVIKLEPIRASELPSVESPSFSPLGSPNPPPVDQGSTVGIKFCSPDGQSCQTSLGPVGGLKSIDKAIGDSGNVLGGPNSVVKNVGALFKF